MHRLTLKYEVSKFIVLTLKNINLMPRGSTHRAVLLSTFEYMCTSVVTIYIYIYILHYVQWAHISSLKSFPQCRSLDVIEMTFLVPVACFLIHCSTMTQLPRKINPNMYKKKSRQL